MGLRVRRLPYANLDPGGRNLVDDYLKRSGWKESVQAKAYMKTLRTSVMSLYEVSEIATKLIHEMLEAISGGCPAGHPQKPGWRARRCHDGGPVSVFERIWCCV